MRRTAAALDLEPDKSLVGQREAELRRLDDDGRIGVHRFDDRFRADARVLFVGDGGDDDIAAQPARGRLGSGEHDRGQTSFHVVSATAVEARAFHARCKTRVGAAESDGVQVPIQDQRPAAAGAAHAADHVHPIRSNRLELDLQAVLLEPRGDEAADLGFTGAAGDEARVHRLDHDEAFEQFADVADVGRHRRMVRRRRRAATSYGAMLWLWRKTFSGSYLRLISTRRS